MIAAPIPPPPPPQLINANGVLSHHHGATVQAAGGGPPPPPPPQPTLVGAGRTKIVPGLGKAIHEAKLKRCGVEETPACAEGVSTGSHTSRNSTSTTPTTNRPKSWHGRLQPNKAVIDEMQNKLAARRAKVDKESDTVPAPNIGRPPRPMGVGERKMSNTLVNSTPPPTTPSRGRTPTTDFGPDWTPVLNRKFSQDSGIYTASREKSWTPPGQTRENSWTPPVTSNQYRRVSVDMERKEELMLAKQVRQNSVKIIRMSPVDGLLQNEDQMENGVSEVGEVCNTSVATNNITSASPIVMRYWNQCTTGNQETTDTSSNTNSGWKEDAIEGEETEFPSIKQKIHQMENEAKAKMVTRVPNVKKNLNLGEEKPAGWMEARKKLQAQLDTLLTKTSAKMAVLAKGQDTEINEGEADEITAPVEQVPRDSTDYTQLDPNVKSLIKSVANEIQKSFSQNNFEEEVGDREDVEETKEEPLAETLSEVVVQAVKHTDESEIDDLIPGQTHQEPSLEAPIDFDALPPLVLDSSVSREKMNIVRKSSRERRLPASILAKRKAADKLKSIIAAKTDTDESAKQNAVLLSDSIKELIEPDNKSDEEKVDSLAKEMAKLESSQVLEILQTVEKGILDFSIPLLLPFLSLQVKLSMSKNIYSELGKSEKTKMVKESILDSLVNDITDIAILQEVIQTSQEKLKKLKVERKISRDISTQFELQGMQDASTVTEPEIETTQTINGKEEALTNELDEEKETNESSIKEEMEKTEKANSPVKMSSSSEINSEDEEAVVVNNDEKGSINTPKSQYNEKSEDSGVDSEGSNVEEKISKSKSEKDIKKALMNILNDAKAQEKTKNVRNFGRTFEFQQVNLKPTIPNDRRPAKARRMDSLWTQQIAAKTGNYNGVPVAPRQTPKSPWTMRSKTEAPKKEPTPNKDIVEFEKCRTIIKQGKADSESKTSIEQASNKEVKDEKECDEVENIETSNEIAKGIDKTEQKVELISTTTDEKTIEKDNVSVQAENVSSVEPNIDTTNAKTSEDDSTNKKVDQETASEEKRSVSVCSSSSSEWEYSETDVEDESDTSSEEAEIKSSKDEPKIETKASNEEPKLVNSISSTKTEVSQKGISIVQNEQKCLNNVPAVFLTPTTRRRMEASTSVTVTVPLSGPPPPPPTFRPPPPPLSPTSMHINSNTQKMIENTTTRFESLQKEVISRNTVEKTGSVESAKVELEASSSGEETEWEEWTEEETDESEYEDEDEAEAEAKQENWKNIMSTSSGPTSFTAEYSIRI